jgi:hypothetical protein
MAYTPEVIEALATLRNYAKHSMVAGPVCEAIETLDNAGVFRELDQQTNYAPAEEILAHAENGAQWADVAAGEQHLSETESK